MIFDHTDQVPLSIIAGVLVTGIALMDFNIITASYLTFIIYSLIIFIVRGVKKRRWNQH